LNQLNDAADLVASEPRRGNDGVQLALEAAGAGTWEIRPVTGEHLLSPRSRELLGIEGDQAISIQRLLDALHPDDRGRWKEAFAQVLDAEGSGECYLEFRTAGPDARWLVASGRAFFEGMSAVRVAGTLRDITRRKRAEEERDVRIGELGHDLRMPLTAISMGIHLVQRDVPAKAEILSAMHLTVRRMERLIGQLLDFARSATGELVLKRERVPLAGICREAVEEAALAHPGHLIEFESWDDAHGEWDRDRLLQVVRNLLSNALSHGAAGEPVVVSVIDCNEDALLAVANRGQPIPVPFREHLFEPTGRGEWPGDHLGLHIVKEIVRAHGGRIELTSDDSATVFHVWLPKDREGNCANRVPPHDANRVPPHDASRIPPQDVNGERT
jgi:sigma-B regulation protein RsbU (phosphoserine phosphatase)